MKKLLLYLSLILFGGGGAGCSKSADPQPDNFTSLTGRWEITSAEVYAQDAGPSQPRLLGQFGAGLAYIFYQDGSYDGCILPGSDWDNAGQSGQSGSWNCTTNKPGRWQLSVTKTQGTDIDDGKLTLTAPTSPFVLEKLYVGKASTGNTNVTVLIGETPVITDAQGGKSWAEYHFTKQ
ncbi:hypothetical protein [Arsenicibacter rosenii]|uniref:Lipocalin-like domain-containing protein n=1 Tax=Arsenicibacter rosenii TaxID=1750698 RepID=A0A1S2V9W9_9BACT|nr:hypothetical protein [Arsenicibacter rosenii]OIN55472.1 hypothetical protein BLX24_30250 [Arsenicibacter rosenii]